MNDEPKHILVVDDEPPVRLLIEEILKSGGYSVSSVGRGTDLLREARTRPPDLIVSDLTMPGLDGHQTMTMLRRSGVYEGPILVVSGRNRDEDIREALEAGAQAYLAKPIRAEALLEAVARLLAPPAPPEPKAAPPAS